MGETRWIVMFNTGFSDEYVGNKVRELLVDSQAVSIHMEKWDEETLNELRKQINNPKETKEGQ